MISLKTILLTSMIITTKMHAEPIFNIFELGVQADKVTTYKAVSNSTISQSISNEAGTLAMYSISKADNPELAYMIEVYADESAYQTHLQSPQYKDFIKQSPNILTAHKKRIELTPIYLGDKAKPITLTEHIIVNFGTVTINTQDADAYRDIVMAEMIESVKVEDGVLAIYAGTVKDKPEQWYFFEVYTNEEALQLHRQTPHFKAYLQQTEGMLNDRNFLKVTPITLMNQGGLNFTVAKQ